MEFMDKVSKRIVELREAKGETQQELADAIGITRQSLSRYEIAARTINVDVLGALAQHFNVTADYLLGLSDVKSTEQDIKIACEVTGLSEAAISEIRNFISVEADEDITDKRYCFEDAKFFKKYGISRKIIMDTVTEKVLSILCDGVLDIFVQISHYFTEMSQRESPLNQMLKYYDVFEDCNTEEEKQNTIELLSRAKLVDFDKIFINGNMNDSIKSKVYSGADNYKFAVYELICGICANIPEIKIEPLLENYRFTSEFISERFKCVKNQEVTDNAQHNPEEE